MNTYSHFIVSDISASGKNVNCNNLLVDSGATSHIINDKSKFISFDKNFDAKVAYYRACGRQQG